MRGRRLAFDYGDARIGVAACDADAILSSPLTVLQTSSKKLHAEIAAILTEVEPLIVYVGLPMNMSGNSGESAAKATAFAQMLVEDFAVNVVMVDERLSTISAQRKLKEAGLSVRDSKSLIDAMSAVAILDQGLLRESKE
jgi:putative Holliday junction resolvase